MNTVMERTADRFLKTAMLCGLTGMVMGLAMAMSGDHRLGPAHAHLNLIGWVGLFLAGLFYREIDESFARLAHWHFALSLAGLMLMIPGLGALLLGYAAGEIGAALGSLLIFAGFAIFGWVVWRERRGR